MNRNGVKGHTAPRQARVLVAKDRLICGVQADQLRLALGLDAVDKCKVDEVIEWRVLIDTTAIWAPQALSQVKVPHFGGGFCIQIQSYTYEDSNSHVALPVAHERCCFVRYQTRECSDHR